MPDMLLLEALEKMEKTLESYQKELNTKYSRITKEIWVDSTEGYLGDSEDVWYETPENVVGTILDSVSGEKAKSHKTINPR